MFFFTLAMIVSLEAAAAGITVEAFVGNLIPVTLGNVIGGSVFVALIYFAIYLRGSGPGRDAWFPDYYSFLMHVPLAATLGVGL